MKQHMNMLIDKRSPGDIQAAFILTCSERFESHTFALIEGSRRLVKRYLA